MSKSQKKLDSFFNIKINHSDIHKRCFIYDPENYVAYFDYKPLETDKYITTKVKIKIYYREPAIKKEYEFPTIQTNSNVPLLKSNLQKAIRRCMNSTAIRSALAILQKNPIELLRRLPIIYIEDVCLMDSYSIIVWMMMAEKEYTLTSFDINLILNVVDSLSSQGNYYVDNRDSESLKYTHEMLQDYAHNKELLSIFYRSQYGGMTGDINMLLHSIKYYIKNPNEIIKTIYKDINIEKNNISLTILNQAIDFHPFPEMLVKISGLTFLKKEIIKELIWFVESGYNIRKKHTIVNSKLYEEKKEWNQIEKVLNDVRKEYIDK